MKDALAVHRDLLARGVTHEIVRLDRMILTADELPEALGLPEQRCVVVRVYDADEECVAVCVPAGTVPAPAAVLQATGARRLGATSADRINAVTDFAAGLVAPTLLPKDMTILADGTIAAGEVVYTPTGESGTALGIHAVDLLRLIRARVGAMLVAPAVVDLTAEPVEAGGRGKREPGGRAG